MFEDSKCAMIPVPEYFVGYGSSERGRIDFVDRIRSWGIEALIDNDGVQEYFERFVGNGKYVLANLTDFIVLNLRKGVPRKCYASGMLMLWWLTDCNILGPILYSRH